MKRLCTLFVLTVLLCGCGAGADPLQSAVSLREQLLVTDCSFMSEITADFGDEIYTFSLGCSGSADGNLTFIVLSPECIASVSGKVSAGKGYLTFDDVVLSFPLLAEGEMSPVSAPWIFLKALRSGYIASGGQEGENTRITLYDSYEEDAIQIDLLLDPQGLPMTADFYHKGRCVLSMNIKDFVFV